MWRILTIVLLSGGLVASCLPADLLAQTKTSAFQDKRQRMVKEAVVGAGVSDERVIQAMLATPRHEFVPSKHRKNAYQDMALPIGAKQTISSPFIVAFMTQSLDPQPTDRVLEIGTGSGFQAAVLSPLVKDVYSIEIVEFLGKKAAKTLKRLNYRNVFTKVGDGFKGWPEHAPFDKIIVTCSPEKAPQPLIDQLREGGLMVIPVGERYQQTLYVMRKRNGRLEREELRPTLFVPMTGAAEDNRQVKPDPAHPRAANGDFEQPLGKNGFVPGWYYQRRLTWKTDAQAPRGDHYVLFQNDEPGRSAHLLQGIPIDGRQVRSIELSADVMCRSVVRGPDARDLPSVAVTFYDGQRRELGTWWLGPWRGDQDWKKETRTIAVPLKTKEGILRIGLFGATGEVAFDAISITPNSR